jgi:hypothetical protein
VNDPTFTFCLDGSVSMEATGGDLVRVHLQVGDDARSREALIRSLGEITQALWDTMPGPELTPMERAAPKDTRCKECGFPQGDHISRGTRVLECPNRCPSCNDQGVVRGQNEDGSPAWVADGWGGPHGTSIDCCPFCALDLRGDWKIGL